MKISQEADYAFRIIMYMSGFEFGSSHNVRKVADSLNVPPRFASKILQKLKQAGVVISYRGIHGGYSLARPKEEITFLQVLEAIDGPLAINRCLVDPAACSRDAAGHCPIHDKLNEIQNNLARSFDSITFAEISYHN